MPSIDEVTDKALTILNQQLDEITKMTTDATNVADKLAGAAAISKIIQVLANIGDHNGSKETQATAAAAKKATKGTLEDVFSNNDES
jgi:hypothetical protein